MKKEQAPAENNAELNLAIKKVASDIISNIERTHRQSINARYQTLASNYAPETKHKPQNDTLLNPQKSCHRLNNDLKQLMAWYDECLTLKAAQPITPSPADIFLSQPALFKQLNFEQLSQLMLRNETAKTDAYQRLNQTQIYTKASLLETFTSLAIERQLSFNSESKNDLSFIHFLLSVPRHAAFFNWQDLLNIFKAQDEKTPLIPFQLAITFPHFRSGWQTFLSQLLPVHSTPYLLALSQLDAADLPSLLPSNKDKHAFFSLWASKKQVKLITTHWQPEAIEWCVNQLCHLQMAQADSIDGKDDEAIDTFNANLIFDNLLIDLYRTTPPLFLDLIRNTNLLNHVSQNTLKTCLNIPLAPSKQPPKVELLKFLIGKKDFHSKLKAPLLHCLCKHADTEQLKVLVENDNVRQCLMTLKDCNGSVIYSLFSEPSSSNNSTAQFLQNNPYQLLGALSPIEILDLASNPAHAVPLSVENVVLLLNAGSKSAVKTPKAQYELNQAMLDCTQKDGKSRLTNHLFDAIKKHENFQEAWLRSEIYNDKWDNLGQGFFSKKMPATIEKARCFLDANGKKTSPLSKKDLNTLIGFFASAKNNSTNLWFFGAYDFRDKATQRFYDKAAELQAPTQNQMKI